MPPRTSILCLVMLAGPAVAGAHECRNWKTIALPSDSPAVQVDVSCIDWNAESQASTVHQAANRLQRKKGNG